MVWPLIAAGVSAAAGAYGANRAANAQESAAGAQGDTARRNMMMQLQLQEPQRNFGYQALGDLSSLYGYSQSPYTAQNTLMQGLTPITAKNAVRYLGQGATFDQLSQMGTLGPLGTKAIKRLTRAGLNIDQIMQLQGMGGGKQEMAAQQPQQGQAGNMSRFFASPDYTFRRDEGQRDIGNSFAARGGAASGNALRALSQFNSNLAAGEFGNYHGRLMQMAGLGSQATNNTAQAGNNYSNAQQNAQQQTGDARASGILGASGAVMGGLNSLGQYWGNRQQQQPAANSQYGPYASGYRFPGG